jgi:hypothetical protein
MVWHQAEAEQFDAGLLLAVAQELEKGKVVPRLKT